MRVPGPIRGRKGLPPPPLTITGRIDGSSYVDIVITSRRVEDPARLRAYAEEKLVKVAKLAPKAIRVDVEMSRERNPRMAEIRERVELTCISPGPVIRAEAAASELFEAFDLAWAKLESRLRRVADRRRVHRARTPTSVAVATTGLSGQQTLPAADLMTADDGAALEEAAGPMVVREKLHVAVPMTLDQALYEMELVGHAFFLFADKESGLPSVVYRRRGYDYGVIRIDTSEAR
jgi:ribosomal subunit interface protein